METQPLVSIITPVYNHEKYIKACIESVVKQTFSDWEMIIVNDGSKDKTAAIIEPSLQLDQRIHLYNQDNKGIFRLSETYNKALQLSKGKYIAILEGDDLWEQDKLERQVRVMESDPGVVLAFGRAQTLNESSGVITPLVPFINQKEVLNNDPPGMMLKCLFFENPISAVTMCLRKDVLTESGGFRQEFNLPLVDLPTIFRMVMKGRFYFDDHILGTWRISTIQATKTYPVEILKGRWELSRHYFDRLDQDTRDRVSVTLKEIDKYFSDKLLVAYARSGRYKLINKDFGGARKDYLKAILYHGSGQPAWRLRAITGYLFSFFGWDVERVARLLGMVTYKDRNEK
jgi:glycosyltransferase involved in cell wall biosynthesis